MTGRVDEVQDIVLAVALAAPVHAHGLRLDGDAALPLQLHAVEELVLRLARRHRPGLLQQPIGERALAVVDVRDDGEIAQMGVFGGHLGLAGSNTGIPLVQR